MAWVYIALVAAFEAWLWRRIVQAGAAPVGVDEPPYRFDAEEAELVGRFRFYFTYPVLANGASSVLAAIGLSALGLAPWLTFRLVFLPAAIIGLNLLAVARFTKLVAPVMALRMAAARGDRTALRALEVHDLAWQKIRAGNRAGKMTA